MSKPKSFELSITGRRKVNQDSCVVIREGDLTFLAVADGMGGAQGGEIASQEVIEVCRMVISDAAGRQLAPNHLKNILEKIFVESQLRLRRIIENNSRLEGMGTTLSCVLLQNEHYVWGNIGDSRVYRISGSSIKQITVDHSFVEEYRKQHGNDIPDFVRARSNVITRSIGGNDDQADIFPLNKDYETISENEGFLICSDGLLPGMLEAGTDWMAQFLFKAPDLKTAAENLVNYAYRQGSTDNISVVLYQHNQLFKQAKKDQPLPNINIPGKIKSLVGKSDKNKLKAMLALVAMILVAVPLFWLLSSREAKLTEYTIDDGIFTWEAYERRNKQAIEYEVIIFEGEKNVLTDTIVFPREILFCEYRNKLQASEYTIRVRAIIDKGKAGIDHIEQQIKLIDN